MFTTIRNAFKSEDLRKRLLFTMFILVIFRFGCAVLVPFADASAIGAAVQGNNFFGFLNAFSGGAFGKGTVFALSIQPYITASIIVQLLTIAIPALERLQKEGETGRKKINRITKYVTLGMSLLQAYGYYMILRNSNGIASEYLTGFPKYFVMTVIVLTFTAGASIVVWMGDQITEKGIGNGISMILFAGILSGLSTQGNILVTAFKAGGANYILVPFIILVFAAMIVFIIIMTEAERRIPVQYAKRMVGRKMYGGQSSFIPIKVSMSGVMPIIFAMSIVGIPSTIAAFAPPKSEFWIKVVNALSTTGWVYAVLYLLLIVAFNYFYVAIQYNPIEIANNIKSNNGAIPGIRPGKPTSTFISKVIGKITFVGAIFLGIIAVFPIAFNGMTDIKVAMGGTSIIIIVGVALETMRQLESQLMMRHHKGFLE